MVWLRHGENVLKICLLVSTEYTNVTDRRTPHDAKQKAIKRVERHVVAVVDRSLVLEGAAADHHNSASDRCVQPARCR